MQRDGEHRRPNTAVSVVAVVLGLGACSGSGSDERRVPSTAEATPTVEASVDVSVDSAPRIATSVPAPSAPTTTVDRLVAPETLAVSITEIERALRDPSIAPDETATWGRSQQRVYQALARTPEWDETVRALLPADILPAFDRIIEARRAVADHAARRAAERPASDPPQTAPPTLPAWTVVEPLPIEELMGYYRAAEAATGVPWAYLAAIHLVETRMGRIDGISSAGAIGPMQFLPETWGACCIGDPLDAQDAILGAATYLVDRGAPADMLGALYGYNPNDGYVGAVDAYARLLLADERAYHGLHAWEVYVGSAAGSVRLPVGYTASDPVDAAGWLDANPGALAPLPLERP